jgi:hypothetical protein
MFPDRPFGRLVGELLDSLAPLRTPGERLLRKEFRGFPLELEDSNYLLTEKVIKPQFATARWTFYELLAYLRTYPCVQRIEWQPSWSTGNFRLRSMICFGGSFGPAWMS